MSPLMKRILSAAVLAPVAIVDVWVGGPLFYVLMAVVFGISVQEWSRLSLHDGRVKWSLLLAGIAYIALACLCAVWIRNFQSDGFYLLLYVLLAVWACDIGAYAAGRLIGGPKMAPAISPNKTWAGLVGGSIAAVVAVILYHAWLGSRVSSPVTAQFSLFFQVLLGLMLAVIGQLGDLMESYLKRRVGLKDSGSIIPGHGGLLDRIDALLPTIPVFALVILYLDYLAS